MVEQADEQPRDPRLGLASLTEEDEVVAGEDRILDGGDHRILVSDDAREDLTARREPRQEVGAKLFLDRARAPAGGLEGAERRWLGRGLVDGRFHGVLPRVVEAGLGPRA